MSSIFKNKKGLGRGLSSLIGDTKTVSKNNKVSVSDLIRNRYQPRKTFDEESLEELTNSIKSRGIIQPIIARPSSGNKYVFNNEYSYNSATKYGLYVKTYTFTNISINHPLAILNSGNTNISYAPKNSSAIIIKVSGGDYSTNGNDDFYTFTDNNNNPIGIGNSNFYFM